MIEGVEGERTGACPGGRERFDTLRGFQSVLAASNPSPKHIRQIVPTRAPAKGRAMRLGFSIVLLTAYLVAAPAHSAVDTHYSDLFDKGVLEYRSGQSIQASETLRLACFGMLSDPARLTECFVHLALAQDAANDRSGFDRTWDSLTEVERLFPSYANANLDETDRRAFEAALQRSV